MLQIKKLSFIYLLYLLAFFIFIYLIKVRNKISSIPDLQLSSTTCWISPPRNGTRTSSKCSKFRAEARPVTRGTYFKEFVGPVQNRPKVAQLTKLNIPHYRIQTCPHKSFQIKKSTELRNLIMQRTFLSNTANKTTLQNLVNKISICS